MIFGLFLAAKNSADIFSSPRVVGRMKISDDNITSTHKFSLWHWGEVRDAT